MSPLAATRQYAKYLILQTCLYNKALLCVKRFFMEADGSAKQAQIAHRNLAAHVKTLSRTACETPQAQRAFADVLPVLY